MVLKNAILAIAITTGLLHFMQPFAGGKAASEEGEHAVQQAEVPLAALASLKTLAGSATLTEFTEETKDGRKFYEGSWQGAGGKVDALVTETGDVVEIEESMQSAKVPAAVRAATEKAAGKGATFERKTLYLYEIHFEKDGKSQELIFTADALPYDEDDSEDEK